MGSSFLLFCCVYGSLRAVRRNRSCPRLIYSCSPIEGDYQFVATYHFSCLLVYQCLLHHDVIVSLLITALDGKELLAFTGICVYIIFVWKYLNPEVKYFTDVLYFVSLHFIAACCKVFAHGLPHISRWIVTLFTICCLAICCEGTYFLRQKGYFVT